MELNELRKLPMPKLRDLAKKETDLKNAVALEKEELIRAIAAAKGIAYDETQKDLSAIHAVKQDIRSLQKQKAELLAAHAGRAAGPQVPCLSGTGERPQPTGPPASPPTQRHCQ